MGPELYSSLFLFLVSAYAVGAALLRRQETDSPTSYTYVFLAALATALGMASNIVLVSGLAPALLPVLDTVRFWAAIAFVYFLYSWTLTVDPWRRPTRRWVTAAAVLAGVAIAVIPSHGNQAVSVPAEWHWANQAGLALFYATLLGITGLFVHLGAQKSVTPGLSWVILFQKLLLWAALYLGAAFFLFRILLLLASSLGFQPLAPDSVALVQELIKSTVGVLFLFGLLPPRWLVRLVRKLELHDNASWQSQYAVQATADLADGTNPVYRHALVTFVTLLAEQCRVPVLSRVDLLQAASLLGTSYPLATVSGGLVARPTEGQGASGSDVPNPRSRPPVVVSQDVARLLEAASQDGRGHATGELKALILRACDRFVWEAYRGGFSAIGTEDAQRGWAAVQGAVGDKKVLDGLRQVLVDADLLPDHKPAKGHGAP